jgi:hypothetical protein
MPFHETHKATILVFAAFTIGATETARGDMQSVAIPQAAFDSPALRYSTTFGGDAGVEGEAIAIDAEGNTIIAGTTRIHSVSRS